MANLEPDPKLSFEPFVRLHQDMVYSTAMRLTGSAMEAEDISQNVFLQAYRYFDRLAGDSQAGGWLRTTARNLALNHLTRYTKRWRFFSFFENDDGEINLPGMTVQDDDNSWLHERIETLKEVLPLLVPKYRTALVLYHYEGLSYEEIGEKLGVSLAKVKSDIFRGRVLLKELIGKAEKYHGKE